MQNLYKGMVSSGSFRCIDNLLYTFPKIVILNLTIALYNPPFYGGIMHKDWLKLQSIGKATTRIVSIRTDLIHKFVPNANATTPLFGKWELSEDGTYLKFYIKADYTPEESTPNTTEEDTPQKDTVEEDTSQEESTEINDGN